MDTESTARIDNILGQWEYLTGHGAWVAPDEELAIAWDTRTPAYTGSLEAVTDAYRRSRRFTTLRDRLAYLDGYFGVATDDCDDPAEPPATHRVMMVTADGESPEFDGTYSLCSRHLANLRSAGYPLGVTYRIDPLSASQADIHLDPQEDDGDLSADPPGQDHIAQAARHDAEAELGRQLLEMYACDPDHWYNRMPIVLVTRILVHQQRFPS